MARPTAWCEDRGSHGGEEKKPHEATRTSKKKPPKSLTNKKIHRIPCFLEKGGERGRRVSIPRGGGPKTGEGCETGSKERVWKKKNW